MGQAVPDRNLWAVPRRAAAEWLRLFRSLSEAGPVACETGDVAAWWPDSRHLHAPSTNVAIAACRRCPAAEPCLSYAMAADERYGIWGGALPAERRRMRGQRPRD